MTDKTARGDLVIAVVGPCVSGKSTLVTALRAAGYQARQPAQEHSYVRDMWQRRINPDILIYLDVDYEQARERRALSWGPERLVDQAEKLIHARQHADLYLHTGGLSAEEVFKQVIEFLRPIADG